MGSQPLNPGVLHVGLVSIEDALLCELRCRPSLGLSLLHLHEDVVAGLFELSLF